MGYETIVDARGGAVRSLERPEAMPAVARSAGSATEQTVNRQHDGRGRAYRRLLLTADSLSLAMAVLTAWAVVPLLGRPAFDGLDLVVLIGSAPVFFGLAHFGGLYHLSDKRIHATTADEIWPIVVATTMWCWFVLIGWAAASAGSTPVLADIVLWASSVVFLLLVRSGARAWAQRQGWYQQAVYLIGSRTEIERVAIRVLRHPEWGLKIAGEIRVSNEGPYREAEDLCLLSGAPSTRFQWNSGEITRRLATVGVHRAIVAGWPGNLEGRTELVRDLANGGMHVDLVSGEPEALCSTGVLHHIEGLALLSVAPPELSRGSRVAKRFFDIAASGIGLILLSPLFAAVALSIKVDSRGSVFYRQERIGLRRRPFQVLKFRSMVAGADQLKHEVAALNRHGPAGQMFKVEDDPRITRVGSWLRRWSVDELPQLWNVLKGNMSIVGPRPLIPSEASLIDGHHEDRFRMRPGITGPWQTSGRSDIPFGDMAGLDYTYVATWSFRNDLGLLSRTVGAVAQGKGAY